MLVDSFLSLFPRYCLDSTWIQHKLILHDDGDVAHSQLWLVRLDQSQFDLIVLLQQFLVFPLPLQLLPFFLGEVHREKDALIF